MTSLRLHSLISFFQILIFSYSVESANCFLYKSYFILIKKEKYLWNKHVVYTIMSLDSILLASRSKYIISIYYKTKRITHNKFPATRDINSLCRMLCTKRDSRKYIYEQLLFVLRSIIQEHGHNTKKIVLYSDECCYQILKTSILSIPLNCSRLHNNIVDEHKYLTKSH